MKATTTTELYTLSLHDALPISPHRSHRPGRGERRGLELLHARGPLDAPGDREVHPRLAASDRKSTRLNSSHSSISYAVFCLTKKRQGCVPGWWWHYW